MNKFKDGKFLACLLMLCLTPLVQANDNSPQHLIFASDSQYPWSDLTDAGLDDPDKEARSKALIDLQYSDIANFRSRYGGPAAVPVMVNGDITAFGHGSERSFMKSVFEDKLQGLYDYGLGNHDYANNVDDCFLNNCAAGSIRDLKERYWGKAESMDLAARKSGLTTIYYGSLAYSKSYGDVHLVQLNNEPTYSVNFSSGNPITPTVYEITPALDWLEKDLAKARAKGKIIILNMHKVYRWAGSDEQLSRFRDMIDKYRVTAVFGGHDHWGAGEHFTAKKGEIFGHVPVFMSGAASQKTYLIATFTADRQRLIVTVVRNSHWRDRKIESEIAVLK